MTVPAGTHRVELRYGSTLPRQMGLLTSVLCGLMLVGWTWHGRSQRTVVPQKDGLTHRHLIIVAAVTILAAMSGLVYLRAGRAWTASPPGAAELAEHPLQLRFGEAITLLGYDVERQPHQLHVALYWHFDADAAPDINAFVHVLDAAGNIAAQGDKAGFSQVVGYSWWNDRLHLRDLFIIELPGDLPRGYQIRVGLWRGDERLAIFNEEGASLGEVIFLEE
jgi:hypothetical protein